ncbi:hypothetical protein GC175_01170 [bacterium]|nr:hypothetical protein [bacterium]
MKHLSEDQLYTAAFDSTDADAEFIDHLTQCTDCHRQFTSLQRLAQALSVAHRSQPSNAQIERYQQMSSLLPRKSSALPEWVAQIRATLLQDSRQRLALQGMRSGGQQAYRLLYTADHVDIELLVDALGSSRHIEGEVLSADEQKMQSPLLVELYATHPDQSEQVWTTESNPQGRFRLDGVALGAYDVIITPTVGPALRIEGIQIT